MPVHCNQHRCVNVATHVVYWPGQHTIMCLGHTHWALEVARSMGFELATEDVEGYIKRMVDDLAILDTEKRLVAVDD
jgi:hypothetical protein